jgi:hypothetical protein
MIPATLWECGKDAHASGRLSFGDRRLSAILARPSSCESLRIFTKKVKEAKRKKGSEGGRPVETASAVEIGKVAFGNFSLMISTAAWKSREERSAFPQLPQPRRALTKQQEGRKTEDADPTIVDRFFCPRGGAPLQMKCAKPRIRSPAY